MPYVRASFCACILICFAAGCGKSPPANQATKPATAAKSEPQPTDEKPDFPELTAGDLAKEFATDQAAAVEKYKNKKVRVTGTVTKKIGDGSDRTAVVLKADDMTSVQCELAIIDAYTVHRMKTLKEGETVAVLGETSSSGIEAQDSGSVLQLTFGKLVP
jgi:hypothetical protein